MEKCTKICLLILVQEVGKEKGVEDVNMAGPSGTEAS